MITIQQPAIAINDSRDFAFANMWKKYAACGNTPRETIINDVARIARSARGGTVKNIVFCCHGSPGFLQLGQGFDRSHSGLFSAWAGLVEKIWIRACNFAQIQLPNSTTTGDGNIFCSEIARNARCFVTASTELQYTNRTTALPFGRLDCFEGLVMNYGPAGNALPSSRHYPSHNWSTE